MWRTPKTGVDFIPILDGIEDTQRRDPKQFNVLTDNLSGVVLQMGSEDTRFANQSDMLEMQWLAQDVSCMKTKQKGYATKMVGLFESIVAIVTKDNRTCN